MYKKSGFTIVELLIVIVVIAILAAISIVAYNGIQTRANNTTALNEAVAWRKLFEVYKATYGSTPDVPYNTSYCLGTGFPSNSGGGNLPRCRDYGYNGPSGYLESENATLMTELAKVGTLPQSKKVPINGTVGSYVNYLQSTASITFVIRGSSSECPSPSVYSWDDGNGRLLCNINFSR